METINFKDFSKLDLRVGKIKNAEDIEGADKLYKLSVDLGDLGERVICAGIKGFYSKEELIDKEIVVVCNLEPRKLRGIESHGMLLAATNKEKNTCVLISPEKITDPGVVIS
jgi:methionine--tRNA ligase beta chain